MGKPFKKELENLYLTFEWACNLNIDPIKKIIFSDVEKPLYIVGSGGSLSACYYFAQLYQSLGFMAKAVTPLELFFSHESLCHSNIVFISAGGRNKDILLAFKKAIECEPNYIVILSMQKSNPLSNLAHKFNICYPFGFDIPTGKDGFLATNSLIAFFTIIFRIFREDFENFQIRKVDNSFLDSLEDFFNTRKSCTIFNVLYGKWGQSVAIDIESKFVEAALGAVLVSDYRNFGHGRHHWFAKREKNSCIIALVTPYEEELSKHTLFYLPNSVSKLIIRSENYSAFSAIELLVKSFYLSLALGNRERIDPGKPGVPEFGRALYNLSYYSLLEKKKIIPIQDKVNLERKFKNNIDNIRKDELELWQKSYREFKEKLNCAKFGCVLFDYDGTLCTKEHRFSGILPEIKNELLRILNGGFIIGIATGRGISVKNDLLKNISPRYYKQIIIGYYNGSEIGLLSDNTHPDKSTLSPPDLIQMFKILEAKKNIIYDYQLDIRPNQISITFNDIGNVQNIRSYILNIIMLQKNINIGFVESSHSMDIIYKPNASKLNIVSECERYCKEHGLSQNILCIGDKGNWPGNDYELLSTLYSLSVDEVSPDPSTCWNLSPVGLKNSDATLKYLMAIKFNKKYFKIDL